jgi:hypothetical protein
VHANALSGAKTTGHARYKGAEWANVGGYVDVQNRVGKKAHACCFGERTFLSQAKPDGFVRLEKRDENFNSALLVTQ